MDRAVEHQQADGRNDLRVHDRQVVHLLYDRAQDGFRLRKADGRDGSHKGRHSGRDDCRDDRVEHGFHHGPVAEHLLIPLQREARESRERFAVIERENDRVDNGRVEKYYEQSHENT